VMKGAKPYVTLGVRSLTVAGRPTVEWEARFSRPYCTTLDGCVAADGRLGSVSLPVGDRVEYFQKIDGDMYGTIAAGWSLSSEATLGLRVAGSIRAG
jgi:hypothetical protein